MKHSTIHIKILCKKKENKTKRESSENSFDKCGIFGSEIYFEKGFIV